MRKFLLFSFLICVISVNAQYFEMPNLTKEQMRQDVEFLVRAIKEIEPNILIREKVTGVDIYGEIDKLAKLVDTINNFENFYYLVQKILLLCQDQHENIKGYYPKGIEENNFYISEQAIEISQKSDEQYYRYFPISSLPIMYIDGKFYFIQNFYNDENFVHIPATAQLLDINNISIDKYINDWNIPIDNSVRWDDNNKKFYTQRLFSPKTTGLANNFLITYKLGNEIIDVEKGSLSFNTSLMTDLWKFSVQYFEKDKILYIRIPSMDYEQIDFLTSEIKKYKSKKIKKVVIDIRYNGGGSDYVWHNVLSALISEPLKIKSNVYFYNTPLVRDYLINIRNEKIIKEFKVDDKEYIETNTSKFDTISPSDNSLNYSGKIYVLVNQRIFSSSLAFVSVCKQLKNLVTVGTPTGYICGRSTTPFFLSLPNSKLIFQLVPCIDMTNKKKPIDYYDTQAEIPVKLDVNFYYDEAIYDRERYSKDFLYNHDPVFQKVLKLK